MSTHWNPTKPESRIAYIGTTVTIEWDVTDDDGAAVSLSGATNRALLKLHPSDADSAAVAVGTVTVSGAGNDHVKVAFTIPTTCVDGRTYHFDLRHKLPHAHALYPDLEDVSLYGELLVKQAVTAAMS